MPGAVKRVLITGGTGMIGRRLTAALVADKIEVRLLSRNAEAAEERSTGVTAFTWNPDELAPVEAFDGVQAVIHLAGEPVDGRWTAAKKRRIRDSRVSGTANLVAALGRLDEAARPAVLVSASAIGYYGETGDDAKPETAPAADEFLSEVCSAWETAATGAEAHGLRVVRLRIGLVLDPDGGALGKMLPLWKLGLGGPMGSGRQWMAWIHRDDLVALMRFAIDTDVSGALNATAPTPVRQADFSKALADELGVRAFLPAPTFALKIALGEFSVEVLGSRRVVPERTQEVGFVYRYPRLEDALAELLG